MILWPSYLHNGISYTGIFILNQGPGPLHDLTSQNWRLSAILCNKYGKHILIIPVDYTCPFPYRLYMSISQGNPTTIGYGTGAQAYTLKSCKVSVEK